MFAYSSRGSSNLYSSSATADTAVGIGIWTIVALILAIVGAIVVYFVFVKAKDEPKNKFLKWLKDFLSFKIMWVEAVLKMLYYFATIFIILFSFNFLAIPGPGVLMWLGFLVLGPVVIRLFYEMSIMFVMVWKNTKTIAENTGKKK